MRPSSENEEPSGDVSNQNTEEPSAPQADTGGASKHGESGDDKSKSQGQEGSSTEGSQATGHPESAG